MLQNFSETKDVTASLGDTRGLTKQAFLLGEEVKSRAEDKEGKMEIKRG